MKKINTKNFVEAAITVAVALALIMPMSTAIVNDTTQPIAIRNQIKEYKIIKPVDNNFRNDNILVSNSPGDDIIPGITKDSAGNTVVTWTNQENMFTWNMGVAYSNNPTDPMSWTGWIISLQGTTQVYSSDTAYIEDSVHGTYNGLYGVDMYYDTEQVGFYMIPDVTTDPSIWEFYYWSGAAAESTYATIEDAVYYYEPYYARWGIVNMYIYHWTESGYDIEDCPMYYLTDPGGGATMFFDAQSHLWTAPAKEPAMAMLPNWFHVAWEYNNATAGKDQIVWKKIDAAVEADIEFTPYQEYVADGKNPEIAAYQDGDEYHIAIVYVDVGNVKCVYSSDDGETWSATPVTVAAGSYPALCAIGDKLYCAYIDGGNLFLKISEDGGENWGAAEQINDEDGTVSAEENSVDIHSAGIVWVDTRDGEKEIYFAALFGVNNPPSTPTITGETKLKPNKEYEFEFVTTDPDGDDVSYYVEWGDGTSNDWTTPTASGTAIKLKHTWTTKDKFIIKCKAKDINGLESDWGTLQVSTPRTRFITFRFLDYFPNAFPILRAILGL